MEDSLEVKDKNVKANSGNVVEERKNKLKKFFFGWIKDDYDKIFLALIILTFLIRLYYFWITKDQALWWDEADYMSIAKTWHGIMEYPVNVIRPLLFPIIVYFFQLIGLGEISVRVLILFLSLVSVYLMYSVGTLFFNKKTGLIASFLLSIYWSFFFFSFRLLVDVPLACLWLATILIFFKGYFGNKSIKYFILSGILLGMSFLMKFTSAALVLIFVVYLLVTERINIFKNKKIISFFLSSLVVVMPFFLYQYFSFGDFFAFNNAATAGLVEVSLLPSFLSHIFVSANWLLPVLKILFILGTLWLLFEFVFAIDLIGEKKSISNRYFFIFTWIIVSIFFFARLFEGKFAEDRYYFIFNPAMFLIISRFLVNIGDFLKKFHKFIPILFLIFILGVAGYQNLNQADKTIKLRIDSFKELKQAGEWINQNTLKNESILVVEESAEIIYYAERNYNIENHNIANVTDLINRIELHDPSYIVLSFYYYLQRNNGGSIDVVNYILSRPNEFRIVKTYGTYPSSDQNLPLVIIVEVNRD